LLRHDHKFHSFVFEGAIDSQIVISGFDRLSRMIRKLTLVVIDNAPTQTVRGLRGLPDGVGSARLVCHVSAALLPGAQSDRDRLAQTQVRMVTIKRVSVFQKSRASSQRDAPSSRIKIPDCFCIGTYILKSDG
jgi:hypothetical protein